MAYGVLNCPESNEFEIRTIAGPKPQGVCADSKSYPFCRPSRKPKLSRADHSCGGFTFANGPVHARNFFVAMDVPLSPGITNLPANQMVMAALFEQ